MTAPRSHRRATVGVRSGRRSHPWLVLLTVIGVILTACGPEVEDEGDRRYAERSVRPALPTATTVVGDTPGTPVAGTPVPLGTPDPTGLLLPPSAVTSAFFLVDGRLLVASVDGAVTIPELPGVVRGISVAPTGDRAAVLVETVAAAGTAVATPGATPALAPPGDESVRIVPAAAVVVIVGSDGVVQRTLDNLVPAADLAAPEGSAETGVATVALGPGPDDLLVVFDDGLLVRYPAEGPPLPIMGSGNLADVRQVSWAPTAKGIAIVAAEAPGESAALFYTAIRTDGIDPVRLAPGSGRTIGGAVWLPDGTGILFTDASGPLSTDSLRQGRDLFVSRLRTDRRDLVVAAGVIGPAAGVVDFVPAAGDVIAYTLARVEGDDVRFNSLWVGSVGQPNGVLVQLPADLTVEGLAWTSGGLMVLTRPPGGEPSVLLIGADGRPVSRAPMSAPGTPTPTA